MATALTKPLTDQMPAKRKAITGTARKKQRGRKVFAAGFQSYSDDQLRVIAESAGGLADGFSLLELDDALRDAVAKAQMYGGMRTMQKQKRASAVDFQKIAKAADKILEELNVPVSGEPHVTWAFRGGLEHQGYEWARRWFKAMERENRIKMLRHVRANALWNQGKTVEAREYLDRARARRIARERRREHWHGLHGMWPESTEPEWIQTSDGERLRLFGQDLALYAAIRGVQRLRTWAEFESRRQTVAPTPKDVALVRGPKLKREPLSYFIRQLAELYERFFGKAFGVSKSDSGAVAGPGIRFVQACLAPLGLTMKPTAIEKAWDRYRSDQSMGH